MAGITVIAAKVTDEHGLHSGGVAVTLFACPLVCCCVHHVSLLLTQVWFKVLLHLAQSASQWHDSK